MKVLILGGTGLISTPISRLLLEHSVDLTLFTRGKSEARFPDGAHLLHGERNQFAAFEQQMRDAGTFDCVIDMICYRPEQAESAIRAFQGRVGHFIFCSTVDVYQRPASRYPITEAEPLKGLSDYARNKVLCEELVWLAHERGDLKATILRPAYTYGEGGKVLDSFGWTTRVLDRLRKGKPIIVHGDGSSMWSACYIDDVARAFVNAIGNPRTFGKAYHTAGEEWLFWDRYFMQMAEAMGAPLPRLIHIPTDVLAKIDPQRAMPIVTNFSGNNLFDNAAAHTDLDFAYTIPWREGARRAIAWLETHYAVENSDNDSFDDRVIAAWERLTQQLVTELNAPA